MEHRRDGHASCLAPLSRVSNGTELSACVLDDDPTAWWITCFAVDPRLRGIGVATALLDAAVGYARDHGATALEGHRVDTDALRAARVGASALFTGTMRIFVACGFQEIGRTYPSRPVMRREV